MERRQKATFKVLLGLKNINDAMRRMGMFGKEEGIGCPQFVNLSWTKKPDAKPVSRKQMIETLGRALKQALNESGNRLEALSVEHVGPGKALGVIKD